MLENCFHEQLVGHWLPKIKEMIPSYGGDLKTDAALGRAGPQGHGEVLGLQDGLMSSLGARTPVAHRDSWTRHWSGASPAMTESKSLDVVLRFGAAMLRSGDTAFRVRDAMGLLARQPRHRRSRCTSPSAA